MNMNMDIEPLTRGAALRIGLASKSLPGTDARALLRILTDQMGHPLTEQRLSKITVKQLKAGLNEQNLISDTEESIGSEHLKEAIGILRGENTEILAPSNLPTPTPYQEGDIPASIRVAVASANGENIDGHFGSCPRFLVYQLGKDEIRLIDIRSTDGSEESDDKNVYRAELIQDCHVIYIQSVGGPAASKLVRKGIHPIKLADGGSAPEILIQLQSVMAVKPPPWLAKIIGVPAEQRIHLGPSD